MTRAIAVAICFQRDSSRCELLFTRGCEPIVFEFALLVLPRWLPFGGQPTFALEAMQGRVKRAVLDLQQVFCSALNVFCDLVAVSGAKPECTQDEHVESALQQLDSFRRIFWHIFRRYSTQLLVQLGRRSSKSFDDSKERRDDSRRGRHECPRHYLTTRFTSLSGRTITFTMFLPSRKGWIFSC